MDFSEVSHELWEKLESCTSPEEILALARQEGIELTDDQLEQVSGGSFWSGGGNKEIHSCPYCHSTKIYKQYGRWVCNSCNGSFDQPA